MGEGWTATTVSGNHGHNKEKEQEVRSGRAERSQAAPCLSFPKGLQDGELFPSSWEPPGQGVG